MASAPTDRNLASLNSDGFFSLVQSSSTASRMLFERVEVRRCSAENSNGKGSWRYASWESLLMAGNDGRRRGFQGRHSATLGTILDEISVFLTSRPTAELN
ncbi:hypothetical protein AnigIFM63309_001164 [Aspergillus niger]|nr:hypothetical protein AnigIFM63309_001164 [Aspergillus niger]